MKKIRYAIISIIYFFLLFFIAWSFAQEKKYPPYPDVWGYEFPWPGKENRYVAIDVAKMPDGDYMVTYVKNWDEKINKYAGILFFSGEKIEFTKDNYNEFWRKNHDKRVRLNQVVLSDGFRIEPYSDYACGRCCPLFHFYIIKKDKNGQIIDRKNLIYLFDKPLKVPINRYCEYNEGPSGLRRNYALAKVVSINPKFVILDDDTFLVIDADGNIIMRFDKNMKGKSHLLNIKLYVIDRKIIDDLRDKLKKDNKYNDQTLTDAIYEYAMNLRKEGEK